MLEIAQKHYILTLFIVIGLFIFFSPFSSTLALNANYQQVKTANSPVVYFLSQHSHRKKIYLNPRAYLSYGHKWSDIKLVSQSELNSWPTAQLLRTLGKTKIYYISGAEKALLKNLSDLYQFNLVGEPILEANSTDLAQYQLVSYQQIGLIVSKNDNAAAINSPNPKQASLVLTKESIQGAHNNTLLSNTDGNLVGRFKLHSLYQSSVIQSVTISLTGVYNNNILKKAYLRNQAGNAYKANINLNTNQRRVVITFKPALKLTPGQEATFDLFIDLASSVSTNQTIKAEIKNIQDIETTAKVEAQFPLVDTEFKIFSGNNYVGKVRVQADKLDVADLSISNGNRTIGKFSVYEDSGNENFYLKEIVFRNQGTANRYDWNDFRLLRAGEVIARSKTDSQGEIKFVINYCRVANDYPAELTVVAAVTNDHNPNATVNLQAYSLWAVGKVYGFSLPAQINNLDETTTLN